MIAARAVIDIVAPERFAAHAAGWLAARLPQRDGGLAVLLTGGATPRPVYEALAAPPLVDQVPWPRIDWYFGDERFVPQDHPDSNFRMARETLFARAPIRPTNIHAIPTEGVTLAEAAERYESELRRLRERRGEGPLFDASLLGIGADGHTASLFPGHPALAETARWVVAVESARGPRISLTRPALDLSRALAFIAAGKEKRAIVARLRAGADDLPVARIAPVGELRFILDREAAP